MTGETGSLDPICAYDPYVPHVPSLVPADVSVAVARSSCDPLAARPDPPSVPFANATWSVSDCEYRKPAPTSPVASTDPPLAGEESLTNDSPVVAVLPAVSLPVTLSVGELDAPAVQLKAFDTYGPPAGVVTLDGVCEKPVDVPPKVAVALEATPDPPVSVSVLLRLTEPAADPR